MPPKLAELIAYCQAHGIKGSYRTWHDPPYWRARVKTGRLAHSAPAETEHAALDRAAAIAMADLLDPMPAPGTDESVAWRARKKG